MKLFKFPTLILLTVTLLTVIIACQKKGSNDLNNNTTNLKIRLTDNPFNATEVNVDIRK